ncbi:MAG: mechanosensitive ion channel family protein [Deltaproteobacteria bacterium]|nr:mechanosensitive ion channel family protein [Deltaproteobacteria bacterium]
MQGLLTQLPVWVLFLILPAGFFLLFLLKKALLKILIRWSAKSENQWDDLVVHALNYPMTLVLLAFLIGLLPVLFSWPDRWNELLHLATKLLAILAVALFIQKLLISLHHRYVATRESLKTYSGLLKVVISVGVYAIFLLIFLDTAGISITPLIASLGVGSVAVALALQDTLSNLFSGFYMVVDQPVRVGDYVEIESGQAGSVEAIGWRSVRLRTLAGNVVIVPNSKMAGSLIVNYRLPQPDMAITVPVGVSYNSDLERVERTSIEVGRDVMKGTVGGVPGHEPLVLFKEFGESSLNFNVILRIRTVEEKALVVHAFIKKLHQRFQKEGIVIPYPTQTIHLKQEP